MNGKEMCNFLIKNGFKNISIKGSHHKLKHSDGRLTIVLVHGNKELGIGLQKVILKQEKLDI